MDNDDIPFIQEYPVATSTSNRAQRCPPKATQSSNTMYMWTFSRNWLRFLMGFPLEGFSIVAKEPMVDGSRPEFTKLAFVAVVRCFWFLNCIHLKMLCIFKESNWVIFSHGAGVDDGEIGGRLLASL